MLFFDWRTMQMNDLSLLWYLHAPNHEQQDWKSSQHHVARSLSVEKKALHLHRVLLSNRKTASRWCLMTGSQQRWLQLDLMLQIMLFPWQPLAVSHVSTWKCLFPKKNSAQFQPKRVWYHKSVTKRFRATSSSTAHFSGYSIEEHHINNIFAISIMWNVLL